MQRLHSARGPDARHYGLLVAIALAVLVLVAPTRAGGQDHPEAPATGAPAEAPPAAVPAEPPPAAAPAEPPAAAPADAAGHAPAEASAVAPEPPAPAAGAPVKLLDRRLFTVRVPRGNRSAEERAGAASRVLENATHEKDVPEVRVEEQGDVAVVYLGATPLIQLGPEDAAAAGDASLGVHAAGIASTVRDVLAKEHSRTRIATTVFNISLVVLSALVTLLLLRKVGDLVDKARAWVAEHPERLPVLRMGGIEVLRPAAFQGAISVALGVVRIIAWAGGFIAWLVFSLSLFEATQSYSGRLFGFVLAPVSELMGRLARSVPVLVIAGVATLAVILLVRFVGLFFGSIARGETSLGWLPRDLAAPTGVLVRLAIVVAALVLAAPLITGSEEGALARAGIAVIVSVGLASAPILASAAVGIAVVYGRHVRVGDVADVGGRSGRVQEIGLLEVRLEDEDGCAVRVPHLLALVHPTRVVGRAPLVTVEISVASGADLARAREIILAAASGIGLRARVGLLAHDAGGAHFRAAMASNAGDAKTRWIIAISEALAAAGIPLGHPPAAPALRPERSDAP